MGNRFLRRHPVHRRLFARSYPHGWVRHAYEPTAADFVCLCCQVPDCPHGPRPRVGKYFRLIRNALRRDEYHRRARARVRRKK